MIKPVQVKPLPRCKIWVKFSDGSEGVVDLSHLVGKGVFALWDKTSEFEKVHIDSESGAISWGNDVDICPDSLYMQVTGRKPDEVFPGFRSMASNA